MGSKRTQVRPAKLNEALEQARALSENFSNRERNTILAAIRQAMHDHREREYSDPGWHLRNSNRVRSSFKGIR